MSLAGETCETQVKALTRGGRDVGFSSTEI